MPAIVKVYEKNGSGETATDKTSGTVRLKKADNATVDLNDPLVVPTSGYDYSYEKWLRLNIASGTFTQISNLRAYTDGTSNFGTGATLYFAVDSAYSTPVIPSTSNNPPQHDSVAMTSAFNYTSASPIDLDAINTGPFDSTSLPKDIGDYLVAVMSIASTATQGLLTSESVVFSWDEI